MYTLNKLPDSEGYEVVDGATVVATILDGGAPRMRLDQLGAVKLVSCQFTCNPNEYDAMMAFYRTGTNWGASPFQISLPGIDNQQANQYTAQVVPNSFKLKSQSGLTYILAMQLYVMPNLPDPNDDLQLMGSLS
jgi:hypothetical protein